VETGAGRLLPTTAATGRGLEDNMGEVEEDNNGDGLDTSLGMRGLEVVMAGDGASFSRDFCRGPPNIDWGITII